MLEEILRDRTPVRRLAVEGAGLLRCRPHELAVLDLEHEEAVARDLAADVGRAQNPARLEGVDVPQPVEHRRSCQRIDTAFVDDTPGHVAEEHARGPGDHPEALCVLGSDLLHVPAQGGDLTRLLERDRRAGDELAVDVRPTGLDERRVVALDRADPRLDGVDAWTVLPAGTRR